MLHRTFITHLRKTLLRNNFKNCFRGTNLVRKQKNFTKVMVLEFNSGDSSSTINLAELGTNHQVRFSVYEDG